MRIGIFGGSYNPPHKMHLNIALELLDKRYVDRVIFVPTGSKYKYKTNLVGDAHRLEMLKIMTKSDERLLVSDYELQDEVVYTCETLAHFREVYPNDEVFFICGADNLSYIDEWKNGIDILTNNKILVIKRDTDDIVEILNRFEKYKENIIVTDVLPRDVSSTRIRDLINNNSEVNDLLDDGVLDYIKKNKLYED